MRDRDTGRIVLERVIPTSRIHIADGSNIVPPLGGQHAVLVQPTTYVPRRPGHYYWSVLQGQRVGIFYGTVYVCIHASYDFYCLRYITGFRQQSCYRLTYRLDARL